MPHLPGLMFDHPAVLRVLRVESYRAWRSLRRFGFDRKDLYQEFALRLLEVEDSYRPDLSSAPTFSTRVCRSRTLNLLESASCERRGGGIPPRSLSQPLNSVGGESGSMAPELGETISTDEYELRAGRQSAPAAALLALAIDVDRVVRTLPVELAEIARLFAAGESRADVARHLNLSRATLYRRIAQLRNAFREAGFAEDAAAGRVA